MAEKIIIDSKLVCERCNSVLVEKELSSEEIKQKILESDYNYKKSFRSLKAVVNLTQVGYVYFECSNCNFWKFIKKSVLGES